MSKGGYAKPIFGYSSKCSCDRISKSIINPIGSTFNYDNLSNLEKIEQKYTSNLADKSYNLIPTDYLEYSELYTKISNLQLTVLDSSIAILLKITKEGLKGAMNAIGISNQLLAANIDRIALQNQVNQLQSGLNQLNVYSNTSGQYQITKTLTFIPLYSYYILIYGLPPNGVGFDPLKVTQLLSILQAYNIDPYNQ